jgi:hypothetical protein
MVVPSKTGTVCVASFADAGIDWFKPHAAIDENGFKEYEAK